MPRYSLPLGFSSSFWALGLGWLLKVCLHAWAGGGVGTSSRAERLVFQSMRGRPMLHTFLLCSLVLFTKNGVKTLELPSLTRAPCMTRGREGCTLAPALQIESLTPSTYSRSQFPPL